MLHQLSDALYTSMTNKPLPSTTLRADKDSTIVLHGAACSNNIDAPEGSDGSGHGFALSMYLSADKLAAGEGIGKAERAELLQQVRAGEFAGPLVVVASTFFQRKTPNRNAVRFAKGTLRSGAKSFKNMVVLVDHDQRTQSARIGTILDSKAEQRGDDIAFVMTLSIAKLHAIESVLDGTIDRFSIGWFPTGPIVCSVHNKPMFGRDCCSCWPGDTVDGKVAEAVFTSWEGIEVSAVNVPAVVGTGIDQVRAALSALRLNNGGEEPRKDQSMDKFKMMLGLPASATDEEVIAALAAQQGKITTLTTERENAVKAAELAAQQSAATRLNSIIESAYSECRLEVVRDQAGARVASAFEVTLRAMGADAKGVDQVDKLLSAMPKRVVSPAELQSNKPAAPTPTPQLGDDNPHLDNCLASFGLDREDVAKFGPQNRAGYDHKRMPVPKHLGKVFAQRYGTAINPAFS